MSTHLVIIDQAMNDKVVFDGDLEETEGLLKFPDLRRYLEAYPSERKADRFRYVVTYPLMPDIVLEPKETPLDE